MSTMMTIEEFLKEMAYYLPFYAEADRKVELKNIKLERIFDWRCSNEVILVSFNVYKFNQWINIFVKFTPLHLPSVLTSNLIKSVDNDVRDNLFLYKYGELTPM